MTVLLYHILLISLIHDYIFPILFHYNFLLQMLLFKKSVETMAQKSQQPEKSPKINESGIKNKH